MKNKKQILYAVVALVLIAFIYNFRLQVTTYQQKRGLEKTFLGYSRAIKSRDYNAACVYGDAAFKTALDLPTFTAQQSAFESQLGGLRSINMGEFDMHGRGSPMQWTAIVEEVRHYDKGELRFACEFHVEDGRWQLLGCKQTS